MCDELKEVGMSMSDEEKKMMYAQMSDEDKDMLDKAIHACGFMSTKSLKDSLPEGDEKKEEEMKAEGRKEKVKEAKKAKKAEDLKKEAHKESKEEVME